MPSLLRLTVPPFRLAMALFALYAIVTVPTLLPRWSASPEGGGLLLLWVTLAAMAWPIARGQLAGRRFWIAMAATAVVLRVVALILVDGRAPVGDPAIYPMLARSVQSGAGLVFHDPFTRVTFHTLYPPAYPLLLAAIGLPFGLGPVTIWLSNVVLDLIAAVLLVRLGRRLGSPPAGRAAAWLFATWPTFALAAPFAQKEPLEIVLMLAIMLLLLGARERNGWSAAAGLGVAAGVLALTQPGLAPLTGVLTIALVPVVGLKRIAPLAARAIPIAALVLLPWWVRNALVMGHFVLLTSTGGLGLWIGNNPQATGNWMPMPRSYTGLPEIEMSRQAAADAKAWIIGHPIEFVRLSATKLVRTMGVEQFTLLRFDFARPHAAPAQLAALFPMLQGALAAALIAVAALAGRVRRVAGGETMLWLAIAVMAQLLVFDLWFEFAERHRYVLMPMLFLVIGCGLSTVQAGAAGRVRAPVPAWPRGKVSAPR